MFVSPLIHHDIRCWNAPLINDIFLSFEDEQILQLLISLSQLQDEFMWGASRSAIFSVKISYRFLKARREVEVSHNSMQDNDQQVWRKIWKIKSIPRNVHFSWRILHAKLSVKNDLFKKGISSDPLCVFCGHHNETISHLYMECHWSEQIWFASSLGVVFNLLDLKYVPFS
jgi:hypothetical protein